MSQALYWLCWSPRQNAFHVESEAACFRTNLEAFTGNTPVDFVPIARFHTLDAAREVGIRLTPTLHGREAKRP